MTELKSFEVSWKIKLDARDQYHAAEKAADILRSRQPIAFKISGNKQKTQTVVPNLVEHVESTIKRFLPASYVMVDVNGEDVYIKVVAEQFRDIPLDQDRMDFVYGLFKALPEEELENFSFECLTPAEQEHEEKEDLLWEDEEEEQIGTEDAEIPEQPPGEAAGATRMLPKTSPRGWAALAFPGRGMFSPKKNIDLAVNAETLAMDLGTSGTSYRDEAAGER